MKTSQKYSQEEIDLAISLWQASGLSQTAFCKQEGIGRSTFQHWMKRKGLSQSRPKKNKSGMPAKTATSFIPVTVDQTHHVCNTMSPFQVTFPNGIRIDCPEGMQIQQLKELMSLV